MPRNLSDVLHEAPDRPCQPLDHDTIHNRARRRRIVRQTGSVTAAMIVVAAAAVFATDVLRTDELIGFADDAATPEVEIEQPAPPEPESDPDGEEPTEPAEDQTDDVEPEDEQPGDADDPDDPALPQGLPGHLVGLTDDYRLVLIDTTNGEEIRTLYTFDNPFTYHQQPDAVPAGGAFFDGASLSPDGEYVYADICCEPVVGRMHRFPTADGDYEYLGWYHSLTPSPDGERFAASVYVDGSQPGIAVLDRDLGEQQHFVGETTHQSLLIDLPVWSHDGQRLAAVNQDGDLLVLDVDAAESLDDAQVVPRPADGRFFRKPAFDAEGRLRVLLQDAQGYMGSTEIRGAEADQLLVIDPEELFSTERTKSEIHDLPGTVRDYSIDTTGRFSLFMLADGSVVWRGEGSQGALDLDVDLLFVTW